VRRLKQELGAPVVCTLQGEDSFLDGLTPPYRDQAWQILTQRCAEIDHFIAISRYYADLMRARLQLPAAAVTVVYTGIVLGGFQPAATRPSPPVIGYLARMHHGKGLGTLVDAFIALKQRDRIKDLKLRIAGAMTATDEPYVNTLRQRLAAANLERVAEFLPNLDRDAKLEFLRSLSVFSVPANYGEAFGLYVIEALASGVPVVQPRHAAFPEIIERTGGGRLCEPDNPASLAGAIEELLSDPDRAAELGQQGRAAVARHFSIEEMARNVEDVFRAVTKGAASKRGLRV
jgi:glycosyltransferase involved in cell wall biosynthesis